MTDAARISARSNHGCWTCRLRRKKCDETRPVCSACVSLELDCHGYGPRPEWMDNGDLQRDQASRFKLLVGQTKARKGRRRQLSTSQPLSASLIGMPLSTDNLSLPATLSPSLLERNLGDLSQEEVHYPDSGSNLSYLLATNSVPSPATSSPNFFMQQPSTFSQNESHPQYSGLSFGGVVDPPWTLWAPNDVPTLDSAFDLESYDVSPRAPQNQHYSQDVLSPRSSEDTLTSPANFTMLNEGSEMSSSIVPQGDLLLTHGVDSLSTRNDLPRNASHHDVFPPKEAIRNDYLDASSQAPNLGEASEDALFMHYLDQVFYVQFPFYQSQTRQGRGWLFSILRRVKAAYHASLALSERHLHLIPSENSDLITSLVQMRIPNSHYDVAVQEFQRLVNEISTMHGSVKLMTSVEILMSLLQILFFELFCGGREKWQTHLRDASRFILALLQIRIPMGILDQSYLHGRNEQTHRSTLNPEIDSAVKFLLGSYIFFDILSSASTRSSPFLAINHIQVLDNFGISLENFVGCPNPAMALILEISMLDKWKREAQSANKLSIVNLAKHGDHIRERLRQELALLNERRKSTQTLLGNSPGSSQGSTHPDISKLYVLSAVTYLDVVVSGAYPEVPEIAESVTQTIVAFQNSKDPRLLRSVVWPFCITGCMALEKHYDFFRGLVSRAGITQWSTGTCFEALQIMEDCWKARVISSESCDWTTTMKRRGCYVLLG